MEKLYSTVLVFIFAQSLIGPLYANKCLNAKKICFQEAKQAKEKERNTENDCIHEKSAQNRPDCKAFWKHYSKVASLCAKINEACHSTAKETLPVNGGL